MLSNNFRIIFRTLSKQKAFTLIHIIGLTLGLTCCLLIYLFIQHELSFDQYHKNADRIYRVCEIDTNQSGVHYSGGMPYPAAPAIRTDMPGFEKVARIHLNGEGQIKLDNGDKFKVEDIIYAEPEFAAIFDFEIQSGNIQVTLSSPNQALISESLARQLFGASNPIGRVINVDDKIEVGVKAIMKDLPQNSSFKADMLISYASLNQDIIGFSLDSWGVSVGGVVFALTPKNVNIEQFTQQIPAFVQKYMGDDSASKSELYFQPLKDWHFEPKFDHGLSVEPIRPLYLWIFGSIGVFILIIAIFNFVNLSTVQALKRSKEVGVRKVLGAGKNQLIGQILGEALMISSLSGLLAAVLSQLSLPFINELLGKQISESLLQSPSAWAFLLISVLTVGLLSGIYPAISFSNFQPVKVLKSRTTTGNRNSLWLRSGLVIAQFTITMALIIGTIVVSKQLNYLKEKDLGFKKEALIDLFMPERDHFEILRTQWLNNPNVEKVSFNIGAPTSGNNIHTSFYKEGMTEEDSYRVSLKAADQAYFETFGLELVAGRWLTKEEERRATDEEIAREDRSFVFVVNETLIKKIGFANPSDAIGTKLVTGINDITAEIIGVTKDFNSRSLHEEIPPIIMMNFPGLYYNASLKLKTGDLQSTLTHVEKVWATQFPNSYFEHQFLDETIAKLYESETQIFYLFQIFAGIAILIACLGLWGLINFVTQQRTKEIGVRKIIGASIPNIVLMLSKDFIFLIIIAAVIATPLAWYAMNEWLQNFAYSTNMAWWVFVLAMLITVLITFLTVGYQSFRAAISNPVESLRAE